MGGDAATLGSTVHKALEDYVIVVYIKREQPPSFDLLHMFFKAAYIDHFHSQDTATEQYMLGWEMLNRWFKEHDLDKEDVQVISCEKKDNFLVPSSIGPKPFNYIWDRFDQTGPGVFRVVDYKSSAWDVKPEDLKKKIQARAYALAAAIQLKQQGIAYERIWVVFHMLRFGTRGISFTHDDNVVTWNHINDSLQEIVDQDPDTVEERLNGECLFCVRKAGCTALQKNVSVGGIHSVSTIEEAIDLRAQAEWQSKGINALIRDLDKKILTEAKERDLVSAETQDTLFEVGISSQRAIDPDMAAMAIGEQLFNKYGGRKITMAVVDKLLKGNELTAEQKTQLRGLIYTKKGEPSVRVTAKNPLVD